MAAEAAAHPPGGEFYGNHIKPGDKHDVVDESTLKDHMALSKADATAVMPLDFTRLPFAALFGYILFGEISDAWTWAGAVIIFVAGLMVTRREKKAPA